MSKTLKESKDKGLDSKETEQLLMGFGFSNYRFKDLENGKVGLIQPDGVQIDCPSIADAMQTALRRIMWRLEVSDRVAELYRAEQALKKSLDELEMTT